MAPQSLSGSEPSCNQRQTPPAVTERPPNSLAACLECRSRKVKCNRDFPQCSNCKKSGVACEFPNPEKKASQTKQLAEDVAAFSGRLSNIEQSLSHRMEILTDLVAQSLREQQHGSRSPPSRYSPQAGEDFDSDPDDLASISRRQSTPDSSSVRRSSIIVPDGPAERFYGASSTYAHLEHSRNVVERVLAAGRRQSSSQSPLRSASMNESSDTQSFMSNDPSVIAEVQRKVDTFGGTSRFKENLDVGDDHPLELPPRHVLDEAIELYLSEYSLEPPLFQKQILSDAVHEQYQAQTANVDQSWVLCFNNIILRSSGWKSRTMKVNSFNTHSVDDKVLSLLLTNANRALRRLEQFCSLRIVNIQALLLLSLIARDFIHFNVFERIFDRVCQLVKQMGLHERGFVSDNPTPEEIERQNVLWVIYSIDKQRLFIRGPPCRIYLFECDIKLPAADNAKERLVAGNLRLTCLVEEIYRHLYSPKASRQSLDVRQQRLERLDRRLENLLHQLESLFTSAEHGSDAERTMVLQLKYAFHIAKLLIHSRSIDTRSIQLRVDTSRGALQIIHRLASGSFIFNGGVVVLERFFCNYSVIAFHEVFESMLLDNSPTAIKDLNLLTTTTNALRLLSHPDRPYSYCTRLHRNFTWCTDIASLIVNARKAQYTNDTTRSSPGFFDPSPQTQLKRFNDFSPKERNQYVHNNNNSSSPPDFGGDVAMEEGQQNSGSGLNSASLSSMSSVFDPNDFATYPINHNELFPIDDFNLRGDGLKDSLVPGLPIGPESSPQFQQALQSAFDLGGGLQHSFSQIMTGQGMPSMAFGQDTRFAV